MPEALDGLADTPALAGCTVAERLVCGPVADSWRLRRGEEALVLRRDRPLARGLGLDRAAEWAHLLAAHRAGLAPEPLWCDPPRGLLLTRYLPGADWARPDPDAAACAALGALLRRVHETPAPRGKPFDLPAIAGRYAAAADTSAARALADEVTTRAEPLYRDAPWRLCHHDAHFGNVVGDEAPRLIDWEYAALGQPLFDLAVVAGHHGLDERRTAALVEGWADGAPPDNLERLSAYRSLYEALARLWVLAVESGPSPG